MTHDIAVFLDLDNLVIGAKQAKLPVDINLILDHITQLTNGRIVLRHSYGDWRQNQNLLQELARAGFTTQSTVRLNSFSKNLADMQIVVDAMDTLVDGHQYGTYVLITGDRDFTPLVQSLHKRGKQVIGVGIKLAASPSLVTLCDRYVFYEDLVPSRRLTGTEIEELLAQSLDHLLQNESRVRASVLRQYMSKHSGGAFDNSRSAAGSFRKFLARYKHLVELEQEGTTTYVRRPAPQSQQRPLHLRYRSGLKQQRLRVIPASLRLKVLKDIIHALQQGKEYRWRELVEALAEAYARQKQAVSKNAINAVMLVARQADVICTLKGRSLATAPVLLQLKAERPFQEAVVLCDAAYLRQILNLSEPFDLEEAALALYDSTAQAPYLKIVMKRYMGE
ncbi:MAG: NYN domain-containing protein [Anaerolineae bacterium]